jgi:shikimate dehydrogenase
MIIDGKTKIYGIIGEPVSHSLSPIMHNAAFVKLGENRVYLPFPVHDVGAAIQGLRGLSIEGVSVTIPHKEVVMAHLDEIDPVALKIGAVNTIKCRRDNKRTFLSGYNTDWLGAVRPLSEITTLQGAAVVILGAGGSARAIGFGMLEAGAEITLCSRTPSRGKSLAKDLGCKWFPLEEVEMLPGHVLINATSVGMAPQHDLSPVPQDVVGRFDIVMDIVYAPLQTRLLKDSEKAGCKVINGLEMLLYQGMSQFELWTGIAPPEEEMRLALLRAVTRS